MRFRLKQGLALINSRFKSFSHKYQPCSPRRPARGGHHRVYSESQKFYHCFIADEFQGENKVKVCEKLTKVSAFRARTWRAVFDALIIAQVAHSHDSLISTECGCPTEIIAQ